jgi:hypothetical protein
MTTYQERIKIREWAFTEFGKACRECHRTLMLIARNDG